MKYDDIEEQIDRFFDRFERAVPVILIPVGLFLCCHVYGPALYEIFMK